MTIVNSNRSKTASCAISINPTLRKVTGKLRNLLSMLPLDLGMKAEFTLIRAGMEHIKLLDNKIIAILNFF
jgi:hypothetical protein